MRRWEARAEPAGDGVIRVIPNVWKNRNRDEWRSHLPFASTRGVQKDYAAQPVVLAAARRRQVLA